MSFGTAHHETTSLMMELMLEMDFTRTKVLDMGCGTGILAILADKMNADKIIAVDNDEWAFNNAVENTIRNNADKTDVILGEIKDIQEVGFDVIVANISRNTILEQLVDYERLLSENGTLLLSGFYETDLEIIRIKAEEFRFRFISFLLKNQWIAAKFRK
jgi:ribosomal protein L11 methyltransferase